MPHTQFQVLRDIGGVPTYVIKAPDQIERGVLTASTVATVTAPTEGSDKYAALFSYSSGANVWVSLTGTATLPSTDSESTDSELNPQGREVNNGQEITLISRTDGDEYCIAFLEVQNQ